MRSSGIRGLRRRLFGERRGCDQRCRPPRRWRSPLQQSLRRPRQLPAPPCCRLRRDPPAPGDSGRPFCGAPLLERPRRRLGVLCLLGWSWRPSCVRLLRLATTVTATANGPIADSLRTRRQARPAIRLAGCDQAFEGRVRRAGRSRRRLRRSPVAVGFIRAGQDGGFVPGDARRAQLAHSLRKVRYRDDDLSNAVDQSWSRLDFMDWAPYERWASLGSETFEQVGRSTGLPDPPADGAA